MKKNDTSFYLILVGLSLLAFYQIYNNGFYFGYWSQRDLVRGQEMFSWTGLDNWFLGAELSFGGGARIPSGINNILTMFFLTWENSREMLIHGQFFLNCLLLMWSGWFLHKNGFKKMGLMIFVLTLISPLSAFLWKTYWNPGLLPGLLTVIFSILFIENKLRNISVKMAAWLGFVLFVAISFHLSALFVIPGLYMVFKNEKSKHLLKTIGFVFFLCLLPYVFYEGATGFVNTRVLLEQINLINDLLYITIAILSVYLMWKGKYKESKAYLFLIIGILFPLLVILSLNKGDIEEGNADSFIYLKDRESTQAINVFRQKALEKNLDYQESQKMNNGNTINLNYNKKNNEIYWNIEKTRKLSQISFNVENIEGFINGIVGIRKTDNAGFVNLVYGVILVCGFLFCLNKRESLFIYVSLLSPLFFYLFIKEITIDVNHSRYLAVSSTAAIFLAAKMFEELFKKSKANILMLWYIGFIAVFAFKLNMSINGEYLAAKNEKPIAINSIVYSGNGLGFETSNQTVANYNVDHSDNNLYDLDLNHCFVLFDSKQEKNEIPKISISLDKYDIYGRPTKKISKQSYNNVNLDSIQKRDNEICSLNLRNRYILSESDKEMWSFYYNNKLYKEGTKSFNIKENTYLVNIKDEFCVNDCISILLKIELKEDGVFLYSNQLKSKSYNYHFYDSGTLSNLKLILKDKANGKVKEITVFNGTLGYLGIQSPAVKKIKEDWGKYFIELETVPNMEFGRQKGVVTPAVRIQLN